MPSATRFPGRIQDMEDYADGQTWAGDHTFNGKIGLGTATVPHSGVGYAKLALEGAGGDGAGPHIQFTTEDDNYPLFQQLNWAHDNVALLFDSYFDGSYRSSYSGGNFRIIKTGDIFRIDYDSGIAPGEVLLWENAFAIDAANGKVGINVVNPSQRLTVNGNILQTTGDYLATDEVRAINGDGLKLYDDGGNGIFVKDGGNVGFGTHEPASLEAKGAVLSLSEGGSMTTGDSIGNISFITSDSSFIGTYADGIAAEISAIAESATGASWGLAFTTATITAGDRAERMRIAKTGNVGIGIDIPIAKLHVDQASTTAAIPVLTLDQADIDQPIVKIIGTAESGSADRTLVAASDFTTPGAIVAWEMVYAEDVGNRFTDGKYYRPLYAIPTA